MKKVALFLIVSSLFLANGIFGESSDSPDLTGTLNQHDPSADPKAPGGNMDLPPVMVSTTDTATSTQQTAENLAKIEKILTALEKLLEILEKYSKTVTDGSSASQTASTGSEKIIEGTVRVNSYLNVRTGPWGKIIGALYEGNKVQIVGQEGDWYKIKRGDGYAYIHANYVDTPNKSAGQTPVKNPGSSGDSGSPGNSGSDNSPVTTGNGRFGAAPCQPMPSRASSEFGMRKHPTTGQYKMHNGIDIPVPSGTRLNALGDGVVKAVGYESGGGNYIIIKYDNGLESFYCHLKGSSVKQGQRVSMGQEVARSDNTGQWTTGAHLHFGLKKNGSYINPRSANIPLPKR